MDECFTVLHLNRYAPSAISEIKVLFEKMTQSLQRLQCTNDIAGFENYWTEKTQALDDLFEEKYVKYLQSIRLVSTGRIEEACDQLLNIRTLPEMEHSPAELAQDLYSRLQDWESLSETLVSTPATDRNLLAVRRLCAWTLPDQYADISTDSSIIAVPQLFHRSCSKVIDFLSWNPLEGILSNQMRSPSHAITKVACLALGNPSFLVAEKLLGTQTIVSAYHSRLVPQSKQSIKIRSAKSKDRITNDHLTFEALLAWVQAYDILSFVDQTKQVRDPDVDEVGGLLSNFARKSKNFKLANRILRRSASSLTHSAKLRASFNYARLIIAQNGNVKEASDLLLDILSSRVPDTDLVDLEIQAKACTLFCKWNSSTQISSNFALDSGKLCLALDKRADAIHDAKDLSSLFIERATLLTPLLPQSWFSFAASQYAIGRKMIDDIGKIAMNECQYFSEHGEIVAHIDEFSANPSWLESFIFSLWESVGENRGGGIRSSLWRLQLSESSLDKLESSLCAIRDSIFQQFRKTCDSYFTFLEVQSSYHAATRKAYPSEQITATVRLLRLFVRYAIPLSGWFSSKFLNSPLEAWISVIPQLLSRVHHSEILVRQQISALLCRIASKYPHLILYHVLSGTTENVSGEVSTEEIDLILESIMNEHGLLVNEMTRWIRELQNITVLWAELWIICLEKTKVDIHERIHRLRKDSARISANASLGTQEQAELIQNTAVNIFRPVFFQLDKLMERTILTGSTNQYQEDFLQKFGTEITDAVAEFRERSDFSSFDHVFHRFQLVSLRCFNVFLVTLSPFRFWMRCYNRLKASTFNCVI